MASEIDRFLLEKKTGKDFSKRIKTKLLTSINAKTNKQYGFAAKSDVKPFYKDGLLDRITIFTPYYIYPILHVGFEGTKKNGVKMRMKARKFLTDATEDGRLVEDLAAILGEARAKAIVGRITFNI